jgi:predicted nucleic-acid-binding protein
MDNVRNMSDEELIFVLGMVRTSADSIESFVEDLTEREELLVELYDQYKDVIDEFKRRQGVFWSRLTS